MCRNMSVPRQVPKIKNVKHLKKISESNEPFEPGTVLHKKYRVINVIDTGQFGIVYKIRKLKSKKVYALKVQNVKTPRKNQALKEATFLNHLKGNKHIVDIYDSWSGATRHYMVLWYGVGGTLLQYLLDRDIALREYDAWKYFTQLVEGVRYAHDKGVCHRDLKAENILMDEHHKICKIADWGFAEFWGPKIVHIESCGSMHYASPEILKDYKYAGPEVDIWALGIILYVLLTNKLPFNGNTPVEIAQSTLSGEYFIPYHVSNYACILLNGLLQPSRRKRFVMEDIMTDKWMKHGEQLLSAHPRKKKKSSRIICRY